MPIYEYRCASCGFEDEFLRKVSEPLLTECPKCHKATFEKQVTAAGFQLKGNGWYATDFKNSGAKPVAKDKSEGEKSDGAQANSEKSSSEKSGADKPADKPAADKPAADKPAAETSKPAADKPAESKKEAKSESA